MSDCSFPKCDCQPEFGCQGKNYEAEAFEEGYEDGLIIGRLKALEEAAKLAERAHEDGTNAAGIAQLLRQLKDASK